MEHNNITLLITKKDDDTVNMDVMSNDNVTYKDLLALYSAGAICLARTMSKDENIDLNKETICNTILQSVQYVLYGLNKDKDGE